MYAVSELIREFGGVNAMARTLEECSPSTVQYWKDKGRFPRWRIHEIREAAEKKGITLSQFEVANG